MRRRAVVLGGLDLRDHNSSSLNFQQHYGPLRDDYSAKPAFAVYRELVRAYARRR